MENKTRNVLIKSELPYCYIVGKECKAHLASFLFTLSGFGMFCSFRVIFAILGFLIFSQSPFELSDYFSVACCIFQISPGAKSLQSVTCLLLMRRLKFWLWSQCFRTKYLSGTMGILNCFFCAIPYVAFPWYFN